jgi:CRP-like cAMP-binding protein
MLPLQLLRRCPLFSLLPSRQWDALVLADQEATFPTGETIFQEGSPGVWAYLVLDGRVRALRRTPTKREIPLGTFGPGEVFGEYALLEPHLNTCTCRAVSSTRLLRLALPPLRPIFAALPGVGPNLKNWLCLQGLVCYLRGQSFLGFMSATSSLAFGDQLQPAVFRPQCTIQADGLADDRWFFIESGRVRLHPDGEEEGQPPRELGAGDCFGAPALVGRGGLPVAVALTETTCQTLPREAFTARLDPAQPLRQSLNPQVETLRRKFFWVGQREEADCGVAALAMVARFHGLQVDLDRLRKLVPVGGQGTTGTDLRLAAATLGLRCLSVRVELERLSQVSLPAIAHLRSGHYVVLYGIGPAGVVIGDPATGIVRISRGSFCADCSGNLLLVHPGSMGPDRGTTP